MQVHIEAVRYYKKLLSEMHHKNKVIVYLISLSVTKLKLRGLRELSFLSFPVLFRGDKKLMSWSCKFVFSDSMNSLKYAGKKGSN